MIKDPIYKPKGRALEYGELALNIYTGCNHGCTYCYVPAIFRKKHAEFNSDVRPREGIVEAVKAQLSKGTIKDRTIHLCFTCDPYPNVNTQTTRDIIEIIKESGNHVQILTKGGYRAQIDFDLLDSKDKFGVTITGAGRAMEPGAASWPERLSTLQSAKNQGIGTWVSCEPVIDPQTIYELIENGDYIDHFKVGKLNHMPSDINWREFGEMCLWMLQLHGRNYTIKEDLLIEMRKGGA